MAARRAGGRRAAPSRRRGAREHRRARRFARQLQGRFRLPVHEVDERYTTTEARAAGAADLDAGVRGDHPRAVPDARRHEHRTRARRSRLTSTPRRCTRDAAGRRAPRCCRPDAVLVGIWSGGAWLAERLQRDLGLAGEHGVISSALHRDDFASRGLPPAPTRRGCRSRSRAATSCSSTTCSTPAAPSAPSINELFDFGRPASVTLAVLVDRGGRELPIAGRLRRPRASTLPRGPAPALARDDAGRFSFEIR